MSPQAHSDFSAFSGSPCSFPFRLPLVVAAAAGRGALRAEVRVVLHLLAVAADRLGPLRPVFRVVLHPRPAARLGVGAACNPDADSGAATDQDWLREVDTSTLPGLLAVLEEASVDRVTAILHDELDPAWRAELESGELTADPEELRYWRRLARADVTTPLTDAEAAYLEHARQQVAAFQDALLSDNDDPALHEALGRAPGGAREQN